MPSRFFSSDREQRLWLRTLAVVLAIYSTLGLASTLAAALHAHGLIATGFLVSLLLVGAVILCQGLKARPAGVEIGVLLGIAVVYFLVFLRMAIPERSHLIEYGVVAVFIHEALTERKSHGRPVRFPALLAVVATSLVGVLDELIQAILPSRVFELQDIMFNVLAAVMAVTAMVVLGWARQRVNRPVA